MRPSGRSQATPESSAKAVPADRLIEALDHLGYGMAVLDDAGCIAYANQSFDSLLREGPETAGQEFRALLRAALERRRRRAEMAQIERWLGPWTETSPLDRTFRLDEDLWVRLLARPLPTGGAVVTLVDVTEFKKREVWLTELHDRLAGEGEDLKLFARHLAVARAEATEALRKAEAANEALAREIAERRGLERELRRMANTDELTGALNRRRFLELTETEIERSNRYKRHLAVLMLDLDHFKSINDRFGHAAGDDALRHFTQICMANLRDMDVFARFGGEEFAALLPETPIDGARAVADRLRQAVEKADFRHNDAVVSLTVSIGVAEREAEDQATLAILTRADRALYAAKAAGRNRVALNTGQEPPVVFPPGASYDAEAAATA